MMASAKLTPFQQRQLKSAMQAGQSLPTAVNPTSSQSSVVAAPSPRKAVGNHVGVRLPVGAHRVFLPPLLLARARHSPSRPALTRTPSAPPSARKTK